MALFNWSERYSVKIKSIDDQHKKLFSLMDRVLNIAHEVLAMHKKNSDIFSVFEELVDYTHYHFDFEEELFDKYSYSESKKHKEIHELLKEKVESKQALLMSGENINIQEVIVFFVEWLQKHILETDMKYSEFLISKGVK